MENSGADDDNLCFQLYERMNVADALMSRTYEDGDQIIKQVSELYHVHFTFRHVHFDVHVSCAREMLLMLYIMYVSWQMLLK